MHEITVISLRVFVYFCKYLLLNTYNHVVLSYGNSESWLMATPPMKSKVNLDFVDIIDMQGIMNLTLLYIF